VNIFNDFANGVMSRIIRVGDNSDARPQNDLEPDVAFSVGGIEPGRDWPWRVSVSAARRDGFSGGDLSPMLYVGAGINTTPTDTTTNLRPLLNESQEIFDGRTNMDVTWNDLEIAANGFAVVIDRERLNNLTPSQYGATLTWTLVHGEGLDN
jgi:hypothetical protein